VTTLLTCDTRNDTCQPVIEGHGPRSWFVFDPVRAFEALVERRLATADDLSRGQCLNVARVQ
jgi:hypothetical protein